MHPLLILLILTVNIHSFEIKNTIIGYCFENDCEINTQEKISAEIEKNLTYLNTYVKLTLGNEKLSCKELTLIYQNHIFDEIPNYHAVIWKTRERFLYKCTPAYKGSTIITFGINDPADVSYVRRRYTINQNIIHLPKKQEQVTHLHINPLDLVKYDTIKIKCITLEKAIIEYSNNDLELTEDNFVIIDEQSPIGKVVPLKTSICMGSECDIDLESDEPQVRQEYITITNCEDCVKYADYYFQRDTTSHNNCIIRLWIDGPPEILIPCNYKVTIIMNMLLTHEISRDNVWGPPNYEECKKTIKTANVQCEHSYYKINNAIIHYSDSFRLDVPISNKLVKNDRLIDITKMNQVSVDTKWILVGIEGKSVFRKDWRVTLVNGSSFHVTWITDQCVRQQQCLDGHIIRNGHTRAVSTNYGFVQWNHIIIPSIKIKKLYIRSEGILTDGKIDISTTGHIKGAKTKQEAEIIWTKLFISKLKDVKEIISLTIPKIKYNGIYTSCSSSEVGKACINEEAISDVQCEIYSKIDTEIKCAEFNITKTDCQLSLKNVNTKQVCIL